ncbi:hypothetical protein LT493_14835 [Streptomyces tricolor]|nr:hypothetical protein [Streptomyces tricolor]
MSSLWPSTSWGMETATSRVAVHAPASQTSRWNTGFGEQVFAERTLLRHRHHGMSFKGMPPMVGGGGGRDGKEFSNLARSPI